MRNYGFFIQNILNKRIFFLLFYIFIILNNSNCQCQNVFGKYKIHTWRTNKELLLKNDLSYIYNIKSDIYEKEIYGKYQIKGDTIILDSVVGNSIPMVYLYDDNYFLKEIKEEYDYRDSVIIVNTIYEFKKVENYYENGLIKQVMSWYDISAPSSYNSDRRRDGQWLYYRQDGSLFKIENYKKGKLKKTINKK